MELMPFSRIYAVARHEFHELTRICFAVAGAQFPLSIFPAVVINRLRVFEILDPTSRIGLELSAKCVI